MAFRVDRGNLQPPKRLPDGRIRVDAFITRTGVFKYHMPDGTIRREYRPPAEVFKPESLATFAMVPVTDDHPPAMLTAANAKAFAVGVTGEQARQDGTYIALPMVVYDATTIKKMDGGKVQVSAGYDCDCVETPGISPEGEPYDAIQTNIVANHVAIVDYARAGAGASVRMDGVGYQADEQGSTGAHVATLDESKKGMIMELKEALEQAAKATARADAADAKAQVLAKEVESLKGERDALKSAVTQTEKARADALDSIEPRIRARVALESKVTGILKGADLAKMTDRDLKVAAIKHLDSVDVAPTQSDAYVDARFDLTIERAQAAEAALGKVRVEGEQARQDAAAADADPEATARAEMIKRHADAYKTKGAN